MRSVRDEKADRQMDRMLSRALTQQAKPDAALQQKVCSQWKERREMNRNKKWMAAAAAVACVLAVAVSVGAAGRYLSSRQVAEEFNMDNMAKAFSEGNGIEINQTQTYGDYNVTLLGVTSGANLGWPQPEEIEKEKTYAVVAIEKTDGTPMPDGTDDQEMPQDFFVSPLIEGYNPLNFNVMTMDGSVTWDVINGVEYRIVECDNVEIFADHKLHLCVMNSTFYNKDAYNYDPETGVITPNADYTGMNLLFDLPLDASKADPQKVEEYLKDFKLMFSEEDQADGDSADTIDLTPEYVEYVSGGEWKKEVAESACVIEKTVMNNPDEGMYTLDFQIDREDGSQSSGTFYFYDRDFLDGVAVQQSYYSSSEEGMWYREIVVAKKQEDGTVTLQAYDRLVSESEKDEEMEESTKLEAAE
ncbi:MAG: hypothetical protein PUA77_00180 [Lachnospiraceae bacterium]|nr:hypothetical protein [Lachnospiraceae bacterium]